MLFKLALAHWKQHYLLVCAQVTLVALATFLAWILWLAPASLDAKIRQDAGHIDLVIAPPTSGLQALLALVYHVDMPVGTIPASSLTTWAKHPMVAQAYSIALGDNLKGFRILGVGAMDERFNTAVQGLAGLYTPEHLIGQAIFSRTQGTGINTQPQPALFPAVAGARVAQEIGLSVGYRFSPSHGLMDSGVTHNDTAFEITGVLQATGTVLDTMVLIPIEAVWVAHEGHPTDKRERQQLIEAREISAVLLRYRNPLGIAVLPREVRQAGYTAASPALESQRIQTYIDTLHRWLTIGGGLIAMCLLLSLALAFRLGMQQRLHTVSVMTTLGTSMGRIAGFILIEFISIWLIGTALAAALLGVCNALLTPLWPRVFDGLYLFGTVTVIGLVIVLTALTTLIYSHFQPTYTPD